MFSEEKIHNKYTVKRLTVFYNMMFKYLKSKYDAITDDCVLRVPHYQLYEEPFMKDREGIQRPFRITKNITLVNKTTMNSVDVDDRFIKVYDKDGNLLITNMRVSNDSFIRNVFNQVIYPNLTDTFIDYSLHSKMTIYGYAYDNTHKQKLLLFVKGKLKGIEILNLPISLHDTVVSDIMYSMLVSFFMKHKLSHGDNYDPNIINDIFSIKTVNTLIGETFDDTNNIEITLNVKYGFHSSISFKRITDSAVCYTYNIPNTITNEHIFNNLETTIENYYGFFNLSPFGVIDGLVTIPTDPVYYERAFQNTRELLSNPNTVYSERVPRLPNDRPQKANMNGLWIDLMSTPYYNQHSNYGNTFVRNFMTISWSREESRNYYVPKYLTGDYNNDYRIQTYGRDFYNSSWEVPNIPNDFKIHIKLNFTKRFNAYANETQFNWVDIFTTRTLLTGNDQIGFVSIKYKNVSAKLERLVSLCKDVKKYNDNINIYNLKDDSYDNAVKLIESSSSEKPFSYQNYINLNNYSFKHRSDMVVDDKGLNKMSQKDLYYGVELEFAGVRNITGVADLGVVNASLTNYQPFTYHTSDSSVHYGAELKTLPTTLGALENKDLFDWDLFFTNLDKLGYNGAHSSCGLHIHLSKNNMINEISEFIFTNIRGGVNISNEEMETLTYKLPIALMYMLLQNNWQEIITFTRRSSENINRWANSYNREGMASPIMSNLNTRIRKDKDTFLKVFSSAFHSIHGNKYSAINTSTGHTIEFRIYRGVANKEQLFSSIYFTKAVYDMAIEFTKELIPHYFNGTDEDSVAVIDKIYDVEFDDIINTISSDNIDLVRNYMEGL